MFKLRENREVREPESNAFSRLYHASESRHQNVCYYLSISNFQILYRKIFFFYLKLFNSISFYGQRYFFLFLSFEFIISHSPPKSKQIDRYLGMGQRAWLENLEKNGFKKQTKMPLIMWKWRFLAWKIVKFRKNWEIYELRNSWWFC